MYQVEDEPIETIHLYVVREGDRRPSIMPVIISIIALSILIAIGVLVPYQQPEQRTAIRVSAVFLPLKSFTSIVKIIPRGVKTIPATQAHGTLSITNGSILSEELPKGMILMGKDGVEVTTDAAVFVPAGSATGYGVAYVSAHTTTSGKSGNIPALDINSVEGASIYIRNLQAFSGGRDTSTSSFITSQDRQLALSQAQESLIEHTFSQLLYQPCSESVAGSTSLTVTWVCQFVSFSVPQLPGVKVLHAEVSGKVILLNVVYVIRPRPFPGK